MSFQTRTTDDLVRIATAGGGFKLAAADRSTDDLIKMAAAAAEWGVQLVFSGMTDRSTEDLVRIADAGEGCVLFKG